MPPRRCGGTGSPARGSSFSADRERRRKRSRKRCGSPETRIRPRDVAFFNTGIRIYPGTELESIARRQGVLSRAPEDMLSPVFYVSPEVDGPWMERELKKSMNRHMNFLNMDSLGMSFLPTIHRIGHRLGFRPPLWRYTRGIRRCLRMAGMDV